MMSRKALLTLPATGIAALGAASVAIAAAVPNRFASELLEAHNHARSQDGAPPLVWNPDLAQQAHRWAQVLASEGGMRHATQDERQGAGENLWMGSAGAYSADFMVGAFVEEKRRFTPGRFPNISRTGNWRDVAHYTQVVWKGTRELGCAVVKGERDDFLVCRYWPAGNVYGEQVG